MKISLPNKLVIKLSARQAMAKIALVPSLSLETNQEIKVETIVNKWRKLSIANESFWLVDQQGIVIDKNENVDNLPVILIKTKKDISLTKGVDLGVLSFQTFIETIKLLNQESINYEHLLADEQTGRMLLISEYWNAFFSLEKSIKLQVGSLQLILGRAKIDGKLPRLIDLRFEKPVIGY